MLDNLNILNIFKRIIKNIKKKEKIFLFLLIPATLTSSFFEIVSIASLLPLLELLFNSAEKSTYLINFNFFDFINIKNEKLFFTIAFIIIVFISIIIKIALNVFTNYVGTRVGHSIITKTHEITIFQKL